MKTMTARSQAITARVDQRQSQGVAANTATRVRKAAVNDGRLRIGWRKRGGRIGTLMAQVFKAVTVAGVHFPDLSAGLWRALVASGWRDPSRPLTVKPCLFRSRP